MRLWVGICLTILTIFYITIMGTTKYEKVLSAEKKELDAVSELLRYSENMRNSVWYKTDKVGEVYGEELIDLIRAGELGRRDKRLKTQEFDINKTNKLTKNYLTKLSVLDKGKRNIRVKEIEEYDLRKTSLITSAEIEWLTKNTNLGSMGKYYIEAEDANNINALFLLALSIHESNWGNSRIARDKNNLFGYKAFDRDPYLFAESYETKEESIKEAAKKITQNYLSKEGKYFRGDYSLKSVGKLYASDPLWSTKVASVMKQLDDRLIEHKNNSK